VWSAAEHSPLPSYLDSHSPAIDMLYRDSSYERSVADPGRNNVIVRNIEKTRASFVEVVSCFATVKARLQ